MSSKEYGAEPQSRIWQGSLIDVHISSEAILAGFEPRNGMWATDTPTLLAQGLSALEGANLPQLVDEWRDEILPNGVPLRQVSATGATANKAHKPDALDALTDTDWHGCIAVLMDGEPVPLELLRHDGGQGSVDDSGAAVPIIRLERRVLSIEDQAQIILQIGKKAGAQFLRHHDEERRARENEDWYNNVREPLSSGSLLKIVQAIPAVLRHSLWQLKIGNDHSTLEMNQGHYYSEVVRYATMMEMWRGFVGDIPPGDSLVTGM